MSTDQRVAVAIGLLCAVLIVSCLAGLIALIGAPLTLAVCGLYTLAGLVLLVTGRDGPGGLPEEREI